MRLRTGLSLVLLTLLCVGCGKNNSETGSGDTGVDTDGFIPRGDTGDEECSNTLAVTFRDFTPTTHPDFQKFSFSSPSSGVAKLGAVENDLGDDGNPVFAEREPPITTGPEEFSQWYETVEDVNMEFKSTLELTKEENGAYVYDSEAFFPIDNKGFGNFVEVGDCDGEGEGEVAHNFHFTTEIHTTFAYGGDEVFTFRGDDDVWVFVNGKLALDLGGLHVKLEGTIDFKEMESELGITPGNTYSLDVFHAERHTCASQFRIETTIRCFSGPFVF